MQGSFKVFLNVTTIESNCTSCAIQTHGQCPPRGSLRGGVFEASFESLEVGNANIGSRVNFLTKVALLLCSKVNVEFIKFGCLFYAPFRGALCRHWPGRQRVSGKAWGTELTARKVLRLRLAHPGHRRSVSRTGLRGRCRLTATARGGRGFAFLSLSGSPWNRSRICFLLDGPH